MSDHPVGVLNVAQILLNRFRPERRRNADIFGHLDARFCPGTVIFHRNREYENRLHRILEHGLDFRRDGSVRHIGTDPVGGGERGNVNKLVEAEMRIGPVASEKGFVERVNANGAIADAAKI